jgi:hypothetical protein
LADGGEARAACRLGYELDRCRQLPLFASAAKNFEGQLAKAKAEGRVDQVALRMAGNTQRLYAAASKACAGFPPDETNKGWEYMLAAAQQGHGPAIMNFVAGKMGLDWFNPANTAEGWIAYKELAGPLLQQALDKGMPEAYEFAALSHARPDAAQRVVSFDPVRSVAIYTALRNLATDDYKVKLNSGINHFVEQANLSSADLAKADADAVSISAQLAKRSTGPIDGTTPEDVGSYCERD